MHGQNEVRKDFTTSERVAIAETIASEQRELHGERRGRPAKGEENTGNGPDLFAGQETREVVAKLAGFESDREHRRAKTVVEKGTPELIAAMDSGEVKVSPLCSRPGPGVE